MNTKNKKKFFALSLAFFLCACFLFSEDSHKAKEEKEIFNLKMKILRIKEQMRYFNKQKKRLNKEKALFAKNHLAEMNLMNQKIIKARQTLLNEKNSFLAVSRKATWISKQNQYLKNSLFSFKKVNKSYIQQADKLIKNGIPFDTKNRYGQLLSLKSECDLPNVAGLEIYNRLWHSLKKELLFSTDSQVYSQRTGQTSKKLLRIGRVLLLSVKNEKETALFVANKKPQWKPLTSATMRMKIRSAFKTIEGKKAPDFILIPILSSIIDFKEKK